MAVASMVGGGCGAQAYLPPDTPPELRRRARGKKRKRDVRSDKADGAAKSVRRPGRKDTGKQPAMASSGRTDMASFDRTDMEIQEVKEEEEDNGAGVGPFLEPFGTPEAVREPEYARVPEAEPPAKKRKKKSKSKPSRTPVRSPGEDMEIELSPALRALAPDGYNPGREAARVLWDAVRRHSRKAVALIQWAVRNPRPGVVLVRGPSGSGKAFAIARVCRTSGVRIVDPLQAMDTTGAAVDVILQQSGVRSMVDRRVPAFLVKNADFRAGKAEGGGVAETTVKPLIPSLIKADVAVEKVRGDRALRSPIFATANDYNPKQTPEDLRERLHVAWMNPLSDLSVREVLVAASSSSVERRTLANIAASANGDVSKALRALELVALGAGDDVAQNDRCDGLHDHFTRMLREPTLGRSWTAWSWLPEGGDRAVEYAHENHPAALLSARTRGAPRTPAWQRRGKKKRQTPTRREPPTLKGDTAIEDLAEAVWDAWEDEKVTEATLRVEARRLAAAKVTGWTPADLNRALHETNALAEAADVVCAADCVPTFREPLGGAICKALSAATIRYCAMRGGDPGDAMARAAFPSVRLRFRLDRDERVERRRFLAETCPQASLLDYSLVRAASRVAPT
jgi:hypothetical protein